MRDAPWEAPRVWPAANRSRSTTRLPRRASCHAVAAPITPAPTTTKSTSGARGRGSGRAGDTGAFREGNGERTAVARSTTRVGEEATQVDMATAGQRRAHE